MVQHGERTIKYIMDRLDEIVDISKDDKKNSNDMMKKEIDE